ncbi:MAG: peptidoglycan DD-metalloendopeptidase family protein [Oscillospiraceae bacterium]|nr:peptidoglycan DD-metalloendopeptidase family protein [Oscillospiraceae bacterium]
MNNTAITSGRLTVGKTYLFQNKADGGRSLNVWCNSTYPAGNLSNVCLWKTDKNDNAQRWTLSYSKNGDNYVLKSEENSAKCLDLYTGTGSGANINAHLYSESSTSYLIFENGAYSNTVRIRLAGTTKNGYYLTANQGNPGSNDGRGVNSKGNVYFYSELLDDESQEWEIIDPDSSSGGETGGGTTGTPQKLVGPYVYTGVTNDYQCDVVTSKCGCYKYSFHYGTDLIGKQNDGETTDTTIKASGRGVVVDKRDNNYSTTALGQTLVVKYDNVLNKNGVNIGDVYFRYCHLASIAVEKNEIVSASTVLGERGHSGTGCPDNQPHLHLEATTNPNAKADNSPSEKGGSTDSEKFDVRNVLYTKTSTTGIGKRECMVDHDSPFNSFINCKHGNAWYSLASFPSYD